MSRAATGVRQLRLPLGTRLFRYTAGSAICLAVSEGALFILVLAGFQGWVASLLASVAGIIPGYPLNRTWTFGRRGRSHVWREVVPYWLTTIGGALFAALLVGIATPLVKTWAHIARPPRSLTWSYTSARTVAFGC